MCVDQTPKTFSGKWNDRFLANESTKTNRQKRIETSKNNNSFFGAPPPQLYFEGLNRLPIFCIYWKPVRPYPSTRDISFGIGFISINIVHTIISYEFVFYNYTFLRPPLLLFQKSVATLPTNRDGRRRFCYYFKNPKYQVAVRTSNKSA